MGGGRRPPPTALQPKQAPGVDPDALPVLFGGSPAASRPRPLAPAPLPPVIQSADRKRPRRLPPSFRARRGVRPLPSRRRPPSGSFPSPTPPAIVPAPPGRPSPGSSSPRAHPSPCPHREGAAGDDLACSPSRLDASPSRHRTRRASGERAEHHPFHPSLAVFASAPPSGSDLPHPVSHHLHRRRPPRDQSPAKITDRHRRSSLDPTRQRVHRTDPAAPRRCLIPLARLPGSPSSPSPAAPATPRFPAPRRSSANPASAPAPPPASDR